MPRSVFRNFCLYPAVSVLLLLGGCAVHPPPEVPGEWTTTRLGAGHPPLAWSPDGHSPAWIQGNSRVVSGGRPFQRLGIPVDLLAWSPDGRYLAAASSETGEITILASDGQTLDRFGIAGRLQAIVWAEDGSLLGYFLVLEQFSFGGNLGGHLVHWESPREPPRLEPLWDRTLDLGTLQSLEERIFRISQAAFDPSAEQLLYFRLKDPPQYPPYLQVVLRHLTSGRELDVAQLPLQETEAAFLGDGDRILLGGVDSSLRIIDPWTATTEYTIPSPARSLATGPGGNLVYTEGAFFLGEDSLAQVDRTCEVAFGPADGSLLMACRGDVWRVDGVPETSPVVLDRQTLKHLRSWRAQGLITPEEYRQQKERLQPR